LLKVEKHLFRIIWTKLGPEEMVADREKWPKIHQASKLTKVIVETSLKSTSEAELKATED